MVIANLYSHLNGYEYLLVRKKEQWEEIVKAINSINANDFTKISDAKTTKGRVFYNQKALNKEFEKILFPQAWKSVSIYYYVTGDIPTARIIANIRDKNEQKQIIEDSGFTALKTNNQVDFVKDRVAVEVQFGKYFSVAYDLHVKHTFFFLRDDIDVGIEIIPTKKMCDYMDSGVPWFENEVANVIREGRSNPTVPIVLIGIEPETIDLPKIEPKARGKRKQANSQGTLTRISKSGNVFIPETANKQKGFDTMAKEKAYKVDTEKKLVYCYRGVKQSPRDEKDIQMYIKCGYEMKWVKAPLTVAKMRRDLKALAPAETYEAFERAYKEKAPEGNTDFSETGFSKACKIYNTWKKAYKKANKEKAEAEEE